MKSTKNGKTANLSRRRFIVGSATVAGGFVSAHSTRPWSMRSTSEPSSMARSQASSPAVRDLGSGR